MQLNRRTVLAGLGGLVVGSAGGAMDGVRSVAAAPAERFAQSGGDFGWQPRKLDLDEVASVAHAGYHHKGYG